MHNKLERFPWKVLPAQSNVCEATFTCITLGQAHCPAYKQDQAKKIASDTIAYYEDSEIVDMKTFIKLGPRQYIFTVTRACF